MALVVSPTRKEPEIRKTINAWATAFRAKDIDGLMANHSPEVVLFDVPEPLQHRSADSYRNNWERWLPTLKGPIGCEIHELSVTVGDDVAFSHCLNRISSKRTSGEATDVCVRVTVGFRKIDGAWVVTHEHVSMPFSMNGGKADGDRGP
jgi:ketosteroid isomerase-like protein